MVGIYGLDSSDKLFKMPLLKIRDDMPIKIFQYYEWPASRLVLRGRMLDLLYTEAIYAETLASVKQKINIIVFNFDS